NAIVIASSRFDVDSRLEVVTSSPARIFARSASLNGRRASTDSARGFPVTAAGPSVTASSAPASAIGRATHGMRLDIGPPDRKRNPRALPDGRVPWPEVHRLGEHLLPEQRGHRGRETRVEARGPDAEALVDDPDPFRAEHVVFGVL